MKTQEKETKQSEPTIGQMVADDYRKAEVFKRFGIDFCCGGQDLLEPVCSKKEIEVTAVRQALKDLDEQQVQQPAHDYNSWKLDFLSDYITETHHKYVNHALPLLAEFSTKVAKVHGETHPEVVKIATLIHEIAHEITGHMGKEEKILFPYIKQLVLTKNSDQLLSRPPFGTIKSPINMMVAEHESAGGNMETIKVLSNGYNPPEEACNTYRVLFAMLQEFENDLHQHIHLENNILFPKAIKLEEEMLS